MNPGRHQYATTFPLRQPQKSLKVSPREPRNIRRLAQRGPNIPCSKIAQLLPDDPANFDSKPRHMKPMWHDGALACART